MTSKLLIVYGSQTGNGESIAKDLGELFKEKGIDNEVMTLNNFKSYPSPSNGQTYFLVVICSTTGNGDCPENGDAWWRGVKLRSAVSN
jgi:sulfite reductase alpha subunit-like flavoprotein